MKKLFHVIFVLLLFVSSAMASTRGDVKVIEASENIRLLGQTIAKDYLYYYQNPKKSDLKNKLYKDLKILEDSISEIASLTKNSNSKNILDFLSYNKDEIKELLLEEVSKEKSILMLDYGESFLEGANSIAHEHAYKFSSEEEMLMSVKNMEYLLERITKYYVATTLNIDKNNNFNSMKKSIVEVDKILEEINAYPYPDELLSEIKSMNSIWSKHKDFLYKSNELSIPNLILASEKNLTNSVDKIILYHKQNQ
jgi:hypothetical protein